VCVQSAAALAQAALLFLEALQGLTYWQDEEIVAEGGSMSEAQFFVILLVAIVAVAFLTAVFTGLLDIERVFEILPLFEDVIGD
jgi:hypothetical protein